MPQQPSGRASDCYLWLATNWYRVPKRLCRPV